MRGTLSWLLPCGCFPVVVLLLAFAGSCVGADSTALFPEPTYVFLLRGETGALISTVPERTIKVDAPEEDWIEDLHFGKVFRCSEEKDSYLRIPSLYLGNSNGFAVSFWMKGDANLSSNSNDGFDVLFSQGVAGTGPSLSVSLAAKKNPLAGVLRATFIEEGDSGQGSFLDSTGCADDSNCADGVQPPVVNDGNWHHVTLSSTSGVVGLYVDGFMVGETEQRANISLPSNASDVFLCTANNSTQSIFDGSVTDLVMYDRGLTKDEAVVLYNSRNPFKDATPGMCSDVPIPGLLTSQCGSGFGCYKLSLNDVVELTRTHEFDYLVGRIGLCVPEMYTNLLPDPFVVPPAFVFYPLLSNRVESYPVGLYTGNFRGVSLVTDRVFGQTMYCNGSSDEYIALDPVAYGIGGRFTINFWVRPDAVSFSDQQGYSWLFSHGSRSPTSDAFGPNQIQIYLTEYLNETGYGHVSAYARDMNDMYAGIDSSAVLNGDGTVGTLSTQKQTAGDENDDVYDGDWHMITLTSQPDMGKGYVLYVDGVKVNELNQTTDITNILGESFNVGGGEPLMLNGDIILCSRGYGDPYPFQGQIAFLSLWEESLIEGQVQLLYDAVAKYGLRGSDVSVSQQEDLLVDPRLAQLVQYSISGKQCLFPTLHENQDTYGCVVIDGVDKCYVGDGVWEQCYFVAGEENQLDTRKEPGGHWSPCDLTVNDESNPRGCQAGFICVIFDPNNQGIGVCDVSPTSISDYDIFSLLLARELPVPATMYPLLDESLVAVSSPQYSGKSDNLRWSWDPTFRASVATCSGNEISDIALYDSAPRGFNETFCFWFLISPMSPSEDGRGKQVLLSTKVSSSLDPEAKMYSTVSLNPLDDGETYAISLDSWTLAGDSLNEPATATLQNDQEWNFACVTKSLGTDGVQSYALHLNGEPVTTRTAPYVMERVDDTIHLCWTGSQSTYIRETMPQGFSGKVSQVMVFDTILADNQIQSLYTLFDESDIMDNLAASPEDEDGLSGGAIVGIIIGTVLGVACLILAIVLVSKRISRNKATSFRRYEDEQSASVTESGTSNTLKKEFSYEYPKTPEILPPTTAGARISD